jgi:hypothetical protein
MFVMVNWLAGIIAGLIAVMVFVLAYWLMYLAAGYLEAWDL